MHERDSKPSKHTSTQHKHIHSFTPTFHAPFNVCAAHTILQHYQNKTKRVSMKSALIRATRRTCSHPWSRQQSHTIFTRTSSHGRAHSIVQSLVHWLFKLSSCMFNTSNNSFNNSKKQGGTDLCFQFVIPSKLFPCPRFITSPLRMTVPLDWDILVYFDGAPIVPLVEESVTKRESHK